MVVYLQASPEVLHGHLLMGKTERPLLKNKSKEELLDFIKAQLKQREPYYTQAQFTLNVDLMENYEKIQITVNKLRSLLGI